MPCKLGGTGAAPGNVLGVGGGGPFRIAASAGLKLCCPIQCLGVKRALRATGENIFLQRN